MSVVTILLCSTFVSELISSVFVFSILIFYNCKCEVIYWLSYSYNRQFENNLFKESKSKILKISSNTIWQTDQVNYIWQIEYLIYIGFNINLILKPKGSELRALWSSNNVMQIQINFQLNVYIYTFIWVLTRKLVREKLELIATHFHFFPPLS